jgi:hypothetical protein
MEIIGLIVFGIFISWLYLSYAPMNDIRAYIYSVEDYNTAMQMRKKEIDESRKESITSS